jgi:hypothetical protein
VDQDRFAPGTVAGALPDSSVPNRPGSRRIYNREGWGAITMTFRMMGPHERGRFAPEAWGHLLSLSGAGLLNAAELEQLIDRAMAQVDGRIALDDLRSVIEGAGYDDGPSPDQPTVH